MVGPGPGLCSGRGGPADSAGDLVPDGEAVACATRYDKTATIYI
jgi:hypothetical protein